jgi:uncharacterized protein (DUF58 family)
MVTIIKRPRWSFWKYEQVYECDVPRGCDAPVEKAATFYKERGARDLRIEDGKLHLSRGNLFYSFFPLFERSSKHDLTVEIVNDRGRKSLRCDYVVLHPYPTVHMPPYRFLNEVNDLHAFVGNPVSPGPQKRFRISGGNPIYRLIYLLYRLLSGTRYHAQRRLTRAGWMVVAGIIGCILMGSDTENTVVYQGLPILFLLLASAAVFSWFFRARFSATRLLPRFGTVGRPFHYRVMVRNLTPKAQTDLCLLENLDDPRPTFREWKTMQLADEKRIRPFSFSPRRTNPYQVARIKEAEVPAMSPKGEVEVRVELEPLRRGVLKFGGVTLARPDPFALFRGFAKVPLPQTALILPKRYPLPPIALPGSMKYQEGGIAMASSVGRSDEFVSLREYRRGDPYRHIHWRSWAKTSKPIVKEFEDEFFVRHALILDTFTDDPRSEAFEEAVSVAASFACTLITQESLLDLLFVGPQAYCFTAGRGLAHADQMLEILAAVRACPDEPFDKLEHLILEHIGAVSGCICVLLSWDEPRRKLIEKLRSLGVPTKVLLVVEAGSKIDLAREEFGDIYVLEAGKIEEGLAKL